MVKWYSNSVGIQKLLHDQEQVGAVVLGEIKTSVHMQTCTQTSVAHRTMLPTFRVNLLTSINPF